MLTQSEQMQQVAADKAVRSQYRSTEELAMRDALEAWCRTRWPDARIVHELVMGKGTVRADLVAVAPNHFAAFEIKGPHDDTSRLLTQVGMYRLASPEVWMVVTDRHEDDGNLMRHLLPSLGMLRAEGIDLWGRVHRQRQTDPTPVTLRVTGDPIPFEPVPRAMLSLLWSAELAAEVNRAKLLQVGSRRPSCKAMIDAMLTLSAAEILAATCRQLRSRDALWRADPPIHEDAAERIA